MVEHNAPDSFENQRTRPHLRRSAAQASRKQRPTPIPNRVPYFPRLKKPEVGVSLATIVVPLVPCFFFFRDGSFKLGLVRHQVDTTNGTPATILWIPQHL